VEVPETTGIVAVALLGFAGPLMAIDSDRDFSGHWVLDANASNTRPLGVAPEQELNIAQQDIVISVSMPAAGGKPVEWFYSLTGAGARYTIGSESRNSIAKWEGAALLINTLVSGPQNYTVMDRWRLSRDHSTLTIVRQIVRRNQQVEGMLVYRRAGPARVETPPAPVATPEPEPEPLPPERPRPERLPPEPPRPAPRPAPARVEAPRPAPPPEPAELRVAAGTRIRLSTRNTVDAKHAHDGDHVYLETASNVSADGWIVIPAGSFVNGTLVKPEGKGRELAARLETLVLPNGVTRDLRSAAPVTLARRTDVELRQGTSVDMTLAAELRFSNEELRRPERR
jgi:hypothetical protein